MPSNVTVERVLDKILGEDGHLEQSKRQSIFSYAKSCADAATPLVDMAAELVPFVEKVTSDPYKVVDRDIEQLKALGYSEDQIFEMTIAIALGAGSGRLSLTQRLIEESHR